MTHTPTREEQEAWGLETRLVHGGSLRSQFAELSEAIYLTQSYVYASAEQAEERASTMPDRAVNAAFNMVVRLRKLEKSVAKGTVIIDDTADNS